MEWDQPESETVPQHQNVAGLDQEKKIHILIRFLFNCGTEEMLLVLVRKENKRGNNAVFFLYRKVPLLLFF